MLRKSANIRRESWKNGKKKRIFPLCGGKNVIFGKGGGTKISHFGQILTPDINQKGK